MMKSYGAVTISGYIKNFPPNVQTKLKKLREVIKSAAPGATETISYRMPTFKLKGNLVHFAAYEKHIGFYPTPSAIKAFKRELSGYATSKGAIQFPLSGGIPHDLVKRIVQFRVMEKTGMTKGIITTCSRGHKFYKSAKVPSCPICWPGKYKKKT